MSSCFGRVSYPSRMDFMAATPSVHFSFLPVFAERSPPILLVMKVRRSLASCFTNVCCTSHERSSLYQSVWPAWNYMTPIGCWFPHHHSKLYHDGSTVPVGSWRHSRCRWIGWHLSRPACHAGWYKAWVPCPAGNTENRWHAAVYIEPHSNRVATEVANFTKKIANFFLGFFADFRFQAWLKKKIKASFIL